MNSTDSLITVIGVVRFYEVVTFENPENPVFIGVNIDFYLSEAEANRIKILYL